MASKRQLNAKRAKLLDHGRRRGVLPIRRELSPESYSLIKNAQRNLLTEIRNDGGELKIFTLDSLAVTLIGIRRFNDLMLACGPKTKQIVGRVESCEHPLRMKIGELGTFGGGRNPKLGFYLESMDGEGEPTIEAELAALESAYHERCKDKEGDYSLVTNPDEVFEPHCTIGRVYEQIVPNFETDRSEKTQYEEASGAIGEIVVFEPLVATSQY